MISAAAKVVLEKIAGLPSFLRKAQKSGTPVTSEYAKRLIDINRIGAAGSGTRRAVIRYVTGDIPPKGSPGRAGTYAAARLLDAARDARASMVGKPSADAMVRHLSSRQDLSSRQFAGKINRAQLKRKLLLQKTEAIRAPVPAPAEPWAARRPARQPKDAVPPPTSSNPSRTQPQSGPQSTKKPKEPKNPKNEGKGRGEDITPGMRGAGVLLAAGTAAAIYRARKAAEARTRRNLMLGAGGIAAAGLATAAYNRQRS